jgi:hypothetical protein
MDGGEDPHPAAAAGTREDIDREDPTQELRPGEAARGHRVRVETGGLWAVLGPSHLGRARLAGPMNGVRGHGSGQTRIAELGWLARGAPGAVGERMLGAVSAVCGHDAIALTRAGTEDPVVAHEVEAGRRDQRREALDELLRREDDVGRAVAPAVLQSVEQAPVREP